MKLHPAAVCIPGLLVLGTACAHHVDVAPAQAATLSPEANAVLADARVFDLPSFMTLSDDDAISFRARLAEWQGPEEERLLSALGVAVASTTVGDVPVVILTPRTITDPTRAALAIHGGGFTLGTARDALTILLTDALGVTTISVDYALAPEAKAPKAVEQCVAVYRAVVADRGAANVVAFGHSAGANVLLATLARAHSENVPMPAAVALLSPLVDLGVVGDSVVANDGRDILGGNVGRQGVAKYLDAGRDVRDPLVSPLFAKWGPWFPRTIVTAGTRDLLLSDATRIAWKLREAQVSVDLVVTDGLWHGAESNGAMPESARVRSAVAGALAPPQLARHTSAVVQ